MADIRIKDLTTTASSTASDDFIAVDGTTNGTRKLNAFSPTFGGNATVTGTLTVNSTTVSGSTSTGALVIGNGTQGGLGVGGDIRLGGSIFCQTGSGLNTPNWLFYQTGTSLYVRDTANAAMAVQFVPDGSTPQSTFYGRINATSTTASTSTSSGALVVSGGVGVAGAMYVGGAGDFAGQLNLNSGTASAPSLKLNSTNNGIYYTGSNIVRIAANGAEAATFGGAAATVVGSFQTGAPAGGTAAAWKLGTVASVSPTSPNRTIEVDIGGTIYYIHAKTTNN